MIRAMWRAIPVALALLFGWSAEGAGQAAKSQSPQQAGGAALFTGKGNCHACHGPAGKGTAIGPDLSDAETLHGATLAQVTAVIRAGITAPKKFAVPMPAMGGAALTPAEIDALARHVVSLRPPTAAR